MLICLTPDDSATLLRRITQKTFLTRLCPVLSKPLDSVHVTHNRDGDWTAIVGDSHTLTRTHPERQSPMPDWALWSDRQSAQPLLFFPWLWWEPMLSAVVTVLRGSQHRFPQSIAFSELQPHTPLCVMVAVYALGVDEVFWCADSISRPSPAWLEHLPVTCHRLPISEKHHADWHLDATSACEGSEQLNLATPSESDGYLFAQTLLALVDTLSMGNRIRWGSSASMPHPNVNDLIQY